MMFSIMIGYFEERKIQESKFQDHILVKKSNGKGQKSEYHVLNSRFEEKFCVGKPFVLDEYPGAFGENNQFDLKD